MTKSDCYKCKKNPSPRCGDCPVWLADEEVTQDERTAFKAGVDELVKELEKIDSCEFASFTLCLIKESAEKVKVK